MKNLLDLEKKINSELATKVKSSKINHEHICINIENENLLEVVLFLKNNNTVGGRGWGWEIALLQTSEKSAK